MLIFLIALAIAVIRGAMVWRRRRERTVSWWTGVAMVAIALAVAGAMAMRDFEARKLATALVMPMGLVWIGLIAATALAAARRAWWPCAGLGLLLLLTTLSGNAWIGTWLIGRLEARVPALELDALPRLPAIQVLGGGSDIDEHGRGQLGHAGDRLAVAMRAHRAGVAPLLIASGISAAVDGPDRNLALETRALWIELGVSATAIRCIPVEGTDGPRTTGEEIAAMAELARREGWREVGLVSSAWHLPRAMALAQRAGLRVVPIAADRRGRHPGFSLVHLVPSGHGQATVALAAKEWLGLLLRGW